MSGQYDDAAGVTAGFVAWVESSGGVQGLFLSASVDGAISSVHASGPAQDGTLWALAQRDPLRGGQDGALIRLRPRTTGGVIDYVDMPHARIGAGLVPSAGRMIDGATLAAVGSRGVDHPAPSSHAIVALVTLASTQTVVLAPPEAGQLVLNDIAPTHQGRVYVGGFVRNATSPPQRPLYFARLRSRASLTLDRSFGVGGVQSVARAPLDSCGSPQTSTAKRMTFWQGRLTMIGDIDRDCDPVAVEYDYLVMRMLPPMHGDGFE